MNFDVAASLDLAVRGGVFMTLALTAGLLARDYRRSLAARLGAAFALGVGAFAICSTPGVHARFGWWVAPVLGLAAGNNLVFWLFAKALFDDGFRLRPWHVGLWLALAAAGTATLAPGLGGLRPLLSLAAAGFALLALAEASSSWRDDLVEPRRRIRLFLVVGASAHILLTSLPSLLWGVSLQAPALSLASALGMMAVAGTVAWSLLRVEGQDLLAFAPRPAALSATPPDLMPERPAADPQLLAALAGIMVEARAYRDERLTIGALAARLGVPEHRLRRVINQQLGHRNFNAFINGYRISEAKAALADPQDASTPILTIALDAGFASLGPFNRAFRAETGLTPSDYRRQALMQASNPKSARRSSKSA